MLARFLIYGAAGWCLEVFFTGLKSALRRDRSATAKTYLWMLPIYGGTALLMERVHVGLAAAWWPLRLLVYVSIIYAAELVSGFILRKALGRCPWDYEDRGLNVAGLIRLDYAPFWFAAGMLFEPLHEFLVRSGFR